MADNVAVTPGAGASIAADDIGGVSFQRVKLIHGADGVNAGDVAAANPLPVDTELAPASALADATANPTVPTVGADAMLFNGATWDRMRGDTTNGLDVDVTRVTGNVTVIQPTATLLKVDASGVAVPVTDGGLGLTVDNAGTFAVQADIAKVNNVTVDVGTGAAGTGTQRVAVASNSSIVIAAGSAVIGKLDANSAVDIGDVDVTSVVPGVGATNLGKLIDGASSGADVGVAVLAIRDDILTPIAPAESDYAPLRVDSTGALWVNAGAAGGGLTDTQLRATPVPVDTELPAAAALADAMANPTTPLIGGCVMGYNGATMDRVRASTAFGLNVDVTRMGGLGYSTQRIGGAMYSGFHNDSITSILYANQNLTVTAAVSNLAMGFGVPTSYIYVHDGYIYIMSGTAAPSGARLLSIKSSSGGTVIWRTTIPALSNNTQTIVLNMNVPFRSAVGSDLYVDLDGALGTAGKICITMTGYVKTT